MKRIAATMFTVMALFAVSTHAEELKALKAIAATEVPPPAVEPAPSPSPVPTHGPQDCHELASRIEKIQGKLRELQSSVVSSVYDTQNVINSWYYQLSANEGHTVYVTYGSYSKMRESAGIAGQNAQFFDQEFNELNAKMTKLLADVARCQ